jgi:hypothetical protein
MRRRLRATCEQPAKARSGGVVRIVMQRISIADHARKSAGVSRIERKECGKAARADGSRLFLFSPSQNRSSLRLLVFLAPPLRGWGPGNLHRYWLAIRGARATHYSKHLRPAKRGLGVKLHSSNPEPLMSALGQ